MKKLKNNEGYTLSIVLVIMVVLAILTSTILLSVTFKMKTTNKIVLDSINQMELEKIAYNYLNQIVINEKTLPDETSSIIDEKEGYVIQIFSPEEGETTYEIIITRSGNAATLKAEIEFKEENTSYIILRWGVN